MPLTPAGVTWLGLVCNAVLATAKVAAGLVFASQTILADGMHSASDLITDAAVLAGLRASSRPADGCHPYGHRRVETLVAMFVGAGLLAAAGIIAFNAVRSLHGPGGSVRSALPFYLALATIPVKEFLFQLTRHVGRARGNLALAANAWHHRSDAMSSIAVLAGGVGGVIGWGHADQLASIIVGLMVVVAGGKTLVAVLHELTEGGLGKDEVARIRQAIERVDGTQGWHHLRTRRVGRETFVELHVLVAPTLSVVDGHHIATGVEEAIHATCSQPVRVMVHVEPNVDRGRRHPARKLPDA